MAGNLTDDAEDLVLDWLNGVGSPTRPTTPLKLALMSVAGSDSAGGTEVTGGSYLRQDVTLSAAAAGACTNTNTATYAVMPAVPGGIVAVEVWNNDGSLRIWHGTTTSADPVGAGDTYVVNPGDLDLAQD